MADFNSAVSNLIPGGFHRPRGFHDAALEIVFKQFPLQRSDRGLERFGGGDGSASIAMAFHQRSYGLVDLIAKLRYLRDPVQQFVS